MKRILLLLGVALMSGLLFAACNGREEGTKSAEIIKVGDRVPAFQVKLHDGRVFDTRALKGRVAVIAFFNTACGDCRRFLPHLETAYREVSAAAAPLQQTEFVAISRAQKDKEVTDYWTEQYFTLPYSAQEDRAIYHLFAQMVIPRVYVVGRSGTIVAAFDDANTPDAVKLQAAVAAAWQ